MVGKVRVNAEEPTHPFASPDPEQDKGQTSETPIIMIGRLASPHGPMRSSHTAAPHPPRGHGVGRGPHHASAAHTAPLRRCRGRCSVHPFSAAGAYLSAPHRRSLQLPCGPPSSRITRAQTRRRSTRSRPQSHSTQPLTAPVGRGMTPRSPEVSKWPEWLAQQRTELCTGSTSPRRFHEAMRAAVPQAHPCLPSDPTNDRTPSANHSFTQEIRTAPQQPTQRQQATLRPTKREAPTSPLSGPHSYPQDARGRLPVTRCR